MAWYVSALVLGGLVGRVGVAVATGLVGWRPAVGALALAPLAAALVMRGRLPDVAPPRRSGRVLGAVLNPALLAVAVTGGSLFFTFVGTFTFVTFRLEEPPFSLAPPTASLVFLLWIVGALGPAVGRLAQQIGWRRLTAAALALATAGVLLTMPASLGFVVLGLACVAVAMFSGYTATQLGVGDVARTDRGAASALYFSVYYGSGALGAYVPGLAWEEWGWNGVAALGLASLAVAAAALVAGRRSGL
jgi:YNFM family putative membrane transporter